ncbi:DNA-binding response regulator, OmpR family, contains REC and winged-helix (wHTH) domain [Nocardioides scoriae]|uniref:DNA-binding response regulator, OmpR family, contains REC and winged-helix (WHTH) domain n=1 Tax=Nocardioides scoriae TaxID=642780 RepID=A0A1H1NRY7_9ACTN|nr:response regulator transcription factor [Nocardioides scoriae]SDS01746.1 DNA-binding response regulator, OmpR family, contains REC and winged-helix (wHTH) domain [Nocardioides scoriae]
MTSTSGDLSRPAGRPSPGSRARVLLVEDDLTIRESLRGSLSAAGLEVRALADGLDLEAELHSFRPDLVVLDWMLPGRDGPELVRVVRRTTAAGVVMLTAREGVADRLRGFDVGVDDYVAKPFVTEELVARIRAVLRRTGAVSSTVVVDDLVIDEGAALVERAGTRIALTATELRLLSYLATNRDRVMSSAQILTQVWGYEQYADNLVQVHVSAVRRKLEAHGPRLIHTERGLGYVLRAPRPPS